MQRRRIRAIVLLTLAAIIAALVPILIAEGSVHALRQRLPDATYADWVTGQTGAQWKSIQATASDGARLDAWLFTPAAPNGAAVILLHGVNDSRLGMIGHAPYLLRAGFTVLMPDSRGHGSSGGTLMTYGILESDDVHTWAGELFRDSRTQRLYGLGASMGAAILIQSLAKEPRFRSIVADSAFDSFEDIAYYRLEHISHLGRWASWPTAQAGFLYVLCRYGVNLKQASPEAAIAATHVPILLIHGARDVNIPPTHSRRLHELNPTATELWLVPETPHIAAFGSHPEEYSARVLEWFKK
ncbi:MAG TPA: alpha/beta fold hydrolase [Verrucomicrobiae bacterium]|nr:alpha/beta fold hydrolase [Verrucomicrobiae bacterium]